MKLIVLNLPRDFTKGDMVKLFRPYGKLGECTLVIDERNWSSKGFGFIEYPSDADAEAAIAALHGRKFGKKSLRVKEAEEPVKRVYVKERVYVEGADEPDQETDAEEETQEAQEDSAVKTDAEDEA